jgi:hypothetical protein
MMDERVGGAIAGVIVIALVLGDIAGCTKAKELDPEVEKLAKANDHLMKAERALAYACGYMHGQRALIVAAKIKIKKAELLEECRRFTDEAIENGFRIAERDR